MNSPLPDQNWRRRTRGALERYFEKRSWPRLILTLVLIFTGTFGFALSIALLHLGLPQMWLRYPLVVLAAYGVFLLLLRGWVEWEKASFNPQPGEIENAVAETAPTRLEQRNDGSRRWWLDWLDLSDVGAEPGCIPLVLLIATLIALLALLIYAILFASALIAEVFLDAFIVAVLYRRLRIAAREHWLGTAVRKTWIPALLTAVLLSLAGWCLGMMAPGAHSIGPALHRLLDDPSQNRVEP